MAVHAHLTGTVAAAGVVAEEVAVVVAGCLDADGVFELCYYCESRECAPAVGLRADDAVGSYVCNVCGEAFEGRSGAAVSTGEGEAGAGFEPDRVGYLGLEGGDLLRL